MKILFAHKEGNKPEREFPEKQADAIIIIVRTSIHAKYVCLDEHTFAYKFAQRDDFLQFIMHT